MEPKRTILSCVALATALAGCAPGMHLGRGPDPHHPNVSVAAGGHIVVDQEPIIVPKGQRDFMITWRLPEGSGLSFPRDGIVVVAPPGEFDCKVVQGGERFTCKNRNSGKGRYKYTIKVLDQGRPLEPLDPFIVNG